MNELGNPSINMIAFLDTTTRAALAAFAILLRPPLCSALVESHPERWPIHYD